MRRPVAIPAPWVRWFCNYQHLAFKGAEIALKQLPQNGLSLGCGFGPTELTGAIEAALV